MKQEQDAWVLRVVQGLGTKFGSKTMHSNPVALSFYICAHIDVCPSSKHRETGMGI